MREGGTEGEMRLLVPAEDAASEPRLPSHAREEGGAVRGITDG